MTTDVRFKLSVNAQNLSAEVDKALAPLESAAAKVGASAGSKFGQGFGEGAKSASIYERALAQTTGAIEQFVAAESMANREIAGHKAALTAGTISQEQYQVAVRQTKAGLALVKAELQGMEAQLRRAAQETVQAGSAMAGLNPHLQATGQSSGAARMGMQQLGYQIGDAATMFAMGGNAAQIFASQLGQTLQAVQLMSGGTSRLAGFLGGPWGIAISTAAIALTPFIGKLFETRDAAKEMGDEAQNALDRLFASLRQAGQVTDALDKVAKKRISAMADEAAAQRDLNAANAMAATLAKTPGVAGISGNYQQFSAQEAQRRLLDARTRIAEADGQIEQIRLSGVVRARQDAAASRLGLDGASRARARAGGSGSAGAAANDNRAREIEAAAQAEKQFEDAIQRSLEAQAESVRLETIRREQGEVAAAAEEARLEFLRQHPLALHDSVEELAKALGITRALNDEERLRLQGLINSANAAEDLAVTAARKKAQQKVDEERLRSEREQEKTLRDLSGLYEDLFAGGTGRIWKNFKRMGQSVLADIAAQWTLSLLSGQGGGSLGQMATAAMGRNAGPWGAVLGSAGSLFGRAGGPLSGAAAQSAAKEAGMGGAGSGGFLGSAGSALGAFGAAVAVNELIGDIFGFKGGPLGIFTSVFKKTKKASASIGMSGDELSVLGVKGNSRSRKEASSGAADSVLGAIEQIAEALGADVDASLGAVSIGVRKKNWRVDPTGKGRTKKSGGAIDFGRDQEEAVAAAIRNLIEDGVLSGISQASLNILKSGKDLQKSIEKAALIESVPKLLKARTDPLGAALDEIDTKFARLAESLREGGASAEQIADARRLWQLERADAIQQIGEASASLKEFLLGLNAGSDSPLSLRQQREEAERAFAPYAAQVAAAQAARDEVTRLTGSGASAEQIAAAEQAARLAAAGIDQEGFRSSASLLLGVSRSMNASGGDFFNDFDRIRALTGGAAGLVDAATPAPGEGRDPFAQMTANNTSDLVNLMADQNTLLKDISSRLSAMNDNGANLWWVGQQRNWTS